MADRCKARCPGFVFFSKKVRKVGRANVARLAGVHADKGVLEAHDDGVDVRLPGATLDRIADR
eukprot:1281216-Prymnesium_polylepis.3